MPGAHAMHFLRSHEDEGFLSIPFNPKKEENSLVDMPKVCWQGGFFGSTFSKCKMITTYHGFFCKTQKTVTRCFQKHPLQPAVSQAQRLRAELHNDGSFPGKQWKKRGHKGFGCTVIIAHVKLSSLDPSCVHIQLISRYWNSFLSPRVIFFAGLSLIVTMVVHLPMSNMIHQWCTTIYQNLSPNSFRNLALESFPKSSSKP